MATSRFKPRRNGNGHSNSDRSTTVIGLACLLLSILACAQFLLHVIQQKQASAASTSFVPGVVRLSDGSQVGTVVNDNTPAALQSASAAASGPGRSVLESNGASGNSRSPSGSLRSSRETVAYVWDQSSNGGSSGSSAKFADGRGDGSSAGTKPEQLHPPAPTTDVQQPASPPNPSLQQQQQQQPPPLGASPEAGKAFPNIGSGKRVFIFTMDSLSGYVLGASKGGAAGELIVREGLMWALTELGYEIDVADSDEGMEAMTRNGNSDKYSLFFFDPWTVVAPSNEVRSYLLNRANDLYILAFFGLRDVALPGLPQFNSKHVLTAYPIEATNSFLGFVVQPNSAVTAALAALDSGSGVGATAVTAASVSSRLQKEAAGVVWGKKAEYFDGRQDLLSQIAMDVKLHIVSSERPIDDSRPGMKVQYHGALDRDSWTALLAHSRFLIGLGNPLLGPSALDAIAAGAMYIDPSYDGVNVKPTHEQYQYMTSQHQYLRDHVGEPYVCPVDLTNATSVKVCVDRAMSTNLKPFIPVDFTRPALLGRVHDLLAGALR